jgi:hypothetical protein
VIAYLLGAGGAAMADPIRVARAAAPYALGVMTVSMLTMLADEPGDRLSGQRTTAVACGPRRARRLALALACGTLLVGQFALEYVPGLWGAVAVGVIVWGRNREGPAWTPAVIGLQLAFLGMLAFAAVTGLVVALYNRCRWGISYPLPNVGLQGGGDSPESTSPPVCT